MNKKLIGKKGQVIHSQTREVISRLIEFMKNEATIGCPTIPLKNYKERVIAATGISESSYKRIVKQSNEVKVGTSTSFSTPHKKRPRCSRKSTLPPQEEEEVRRIVNNYYLVEKRLRCYSRY
ncbi:unnamed protein product [Tenebrio molitor]|jgi:hypothetical protein|nr:unnamed protein product [Tenebrio molitor]